MPKKFDIFDIRSTSEEARVRVRINEADYLVVEWQAIVGRLYARASRYRRVTKKHAAWKKAADVRAKVNEAYLEQHGENT